MTPSSSRKTILATHLAAGDTARAAAVLRLTMEEPPDPAAMAALARMVAGVSGFERFRLHIETPLAVGGLAPALAVFAGGDGLRVDATVVHPSERGSRSDTAAGMSSDLAIVLPTAPGALADREAPDRLVQHALTDAERYRRAGARHVLIGDWPLPDHATGSITCRGTESGPASLLMAANLRLREAVASLAGLSVLDCSGLAARPETGAWTDPRLSLLAGPTLSWTAALALAREITIWARAFTGRNRKLYVTDLDGVLWGGVLGEDGIGHLTLGPEGSGAAFQQLQHTLKRFGEEGALLAALSKNDPSDVDAAFDRHPGMVLHRDDFVAVRAGWDDKPLVMQGLLNDLNVAPGHCAFLDDNPVERLAMRAAFPEIVVPDCAGDPIALTAYLQRSGWSDGLGTTHEDRLRAASLAVSAVVRGHQETGCGLADLQMVAEILTGDRVPVDRAVQMSRRVTQFNTTGRRIDAADVARMATAPDQMIIVVGLKDRYADHGRVGLIALSLQGNAAYIDHFLVSCRALDRGVETLLLDRAIRWAKGRGAETLDGMIVETSRNTPVRSVYERHGFAPIPGEDTPGTSRWILGLNDPLTWEAPAIATA